MNRGLDVYILFCYAENMGNLVIFPDFYNAFQRHFNDAKYLYDDSRLPNADQLYAYSAECGLKCIMQQFGMFVDPSSGAPDKKDRKHIDKIWIRYESYRMGIGASGYELPQNNPFDNWDINQRYVHSSIINRTIVDVHKTGAEIVKKLVHKAILEGRLII
jgi:hypothetical protein